MTKIMIRFQEKSSLIIKLEKNELTDDDDFFCVFVMLSYFRVICVRVKFSLFVDYRKQTEIRGRQ